MFKDKIKDLIKIEKNDEKNGNEKIKIENLVFFVILLIITIVIINYIWNGNKVNKQVTNTYSTKLADNSKKAENDKKTESKDFLENNLEEILSNINGVGNVKVFIRYSESEETVAMYNENSKTSTTEENENGENRKIEEKDVNKEVIYQEVDGNKTPIVQKTKEPKLEGAIITATGVTNADVKSNIILAVEAVTGLPTHKIQVFEMKN